MPTKSSRPRASARTRRPAKHERATKGDTLIALMRADGGATAQSLAEAVGWQVHSVRGFIAGALRKRTDLTVCTTREDGLTRYSVADSAAADPA